MTDNRLRKAELSDLPQIIEIDNEAYGSHAYGWLVLRQLFDISGDFLMVAERETIVGYALGARRFGTSVGWILSLAVSARARKTGVGECLTGRLVDELVRSGANCILLTVELQNVGAKKLYQKFGFIETGLETDYFGASENRIIMQFTPE